MARAMHASLSGKGTRVEEVCRRVSRPDLIFGIRRRRRTHLLRQSRSRVLQPVASLEFGGSGFICGHNI
jgi:hypothetical protein